MINRFRFEAMGLDKDLLQEQLEATALKMIAAADEINEHRGSWECTDEAITGSPGQYKGRMVFMHRGLLGTREYTRMEALADGY
jgi:hypothetical protein